VTDRQLILRMKNVAIARRWLGSAGGDPVFAAESVLCSPMPTAEAWLRLRRPILFLSVEDGAGDPEGEATDYMRQRVRGTLVVSHAGDLFGEKALIGAHRESKLTGAGRGLLEVQKEVYAALRNLGPERGVRVRSIAQSAAVPELIENVGYVISRDYRFEGDVTTFETCPEPREVGATLAGATVTLSWAAPDDTTDLVTYVVRRVAGPVPVAFRTEGTGIALGSPLDLSVADSPGPGTWTYSVFARYADPGGSIALNDSDCGFVTVTVP
jgi:hypothetical protein